MTDEKIQRINELAKKAKAEELSADEREEQEKLRKEYIHDVRENLRNSLKGVYLKK